MSSPSPSPRLLTQPRRPQRAISAARWLSAAAIAISLVAPAAASAQPAPKPKPAARAKTPVGVLVTAGPGGALDRAKRAELGRAMRQALRANQRLEVRDLDRTLADRDQQIPHQRLSEARGLLELGEALLARGRPQDAVPRLSAAAEQMRQMLAHVRPSALARAHYLLGAALAMRDQPRAARRQFEALLIWQPEFTADSQAVNRAAHDLLRATADEVRKLPKGAIDVTTEPAGARVWIDGEALGPAPVSRGELSVGTHYVTVALPGHARVAREVAVYKHTRAEVALTLAPLPGSDEVAQAAATLARSLPDPTATAAETAPSRTAASQAERSAAAALGERLGIAHALIVRHLAGKDGAHLQGAVFDTQTGLALATATAPLPDPGARPDTAVTELARALYSGGLLGSERQPPADDSAKTRTAQRDTTSAPIYRRWWFWTGIAAVTAAVVTPVLLLRDDGGATCPGASTCGQVEWRF